MDANLQLKQTCFLQNSYIQNLNFLIQMQQKLKKKGKGIIKTCDLFGHGARLVYQGQSQYETITGGLISIMLIFIFIVLFWSTMESTLNKENVKVSENNHYDQQPKQTQFQLKNSMMFAVGLNNIDLINGPRYFDIFMQQRNQSSTGRIKTEIQLSLCKRQDWDTFGYGQTFDRVKMNTWLCPQQGLNTKLQVEGKYTSETFKYAKISVRKCDPLLDTSRPCASDSVIDNYLQQHQSFTFNFYYINTMINSCNQTANQTFLDDTNYFLFSKQDGISADLFVSQYEIDTDQSLLPNQDHIKISGVLVANKAETQSYKVRGTEYVKFYIRKSTLSRQIARSYRKIDDLISYMGGLFSFLLAAFGFISIYNEYSYHIEVTRRSFNYDEKQKFDHNSLNLFTFFGLMIYSFFQELDIELGWKSIKKIYDFSSESCQHLDISLIFQKLQFVEKLAKVILTESQYAGLLMSRPSSIQEAKSTRQDLTRYSKFRKHCCGDQEPNYYFDDVYEDQRNSDQSLSTVAKVSDSSKKTQNKAVQASFQIIADTFAKQEQIANENIRMRLIENQMYQKIGKPLKHLQAQKQNQRSFARKIWNIIDEKVIKRYSQAEKQKRTAQKPGKTRMVRIQSNQQLTEEVK